MQWKKHEHLVWTTNDRAGHSLGGAVAVLCVLRLLRQLPPDAQPAVHCHVFACPAIGNAALAMYVKERGWERYFSNMLIPGAARSPVAC